MVFDQEQNIWDRIFKILLPIWKVLVAQNPTEAPVAEVGTEGSLDDFTSQIQTEEYRASLQGKLLAVLSYERCPFYRLDSATLEMMVN
ncbi:hypothetical protein ACFX13_038185 [Malus domestica]